MALMLPDLLATLETLLPPVPTTTQSHNFQISSSTPISPANAALLSEFLTQLDTNLDALDSTCALLDGITRTARELRQEHLALKAQYRPLLSSIRRLPNEVLSLVFEQVHLDKKDAAPKKGCNHFSSACSPMVLTHVNREWRSIALHTPSLWSQLIVELPALECTDGFLLLVQAWITRSGASPLTIVLEADPTTALHSLRNKALTSMLFSQIHRWHTIKFCLPAKFYFSQSLFRVPHRAPLLQKIHFEAVERRGARPDRLPFQWDAEMPSLREVTICSSMGPLIEAGSLPWQNLSNLELHIIPLQDLLHILSQAPHLRTLRVSRYYGLSQPVSINLDSLETLDITDALSSDILAGITAPALKRLKYGAYEGAPHQTVDFLARSPLLKTLDMKLGVNPSFLSYIQHPTNISSLSLVVQEGPRARFVLDFLRNSLLNDPPVNPGGRAPPFDQLKTLRIQVVNLNLSPSSHIIDCAMHLRDIVQNLAISLGQSKACPHLEKIYLRVQHTVGQEDHLANQMFMPLKEMNIPRLEVIFCGRERESRL